MSFVNKRTELTPTVAKLYKSQILNIEFETDPQIVAKIVPPPLQLTNTCQASFFIASYGKSSFGALPYKEAAIFIETAYNAKMGYYCPFMLVTDDVAMIQGREICGFPKKMGEISLERQGDEIRAHVRRKGKELASATAAMKQTVAPETIAPVFGERLFLFKSFWNPELTGFDYQPRLVETVMDEEVKTVEEGQGVLSFGESQFDPIHEIPIGNIQRVTYRCGTFSVNPSKVVGEVKGPEYMPYSFSRYV